MTVTSDASAPRRLPSTILAEVDAPKPIREVLVCTFMEPQRGYSQNCMRCSSARSTHVVHLEQRVYGRTTVVHHQGRPGSRQGGLKRTTYAAVVEEVPEINWKAKKAVCTPCLREIQQGLGWQPAARNEAGQMIPADPMATGWRQQAPHNQTEPPPPTEHRVFASNQRFGAGAGADSEGQTATVHRGRVEFFKATKQITEWVTEAEVFENSAKLTGFVLVRELPESGWRTRVCDRCKLKALITHGMTCSAQLGERQDTTDLKFSWQLCSGCGQQAQEKSFSRVRA